MKKTMTVKGLPTMAIILLQLLTFNMQGLNAMPDDSYTSEREALYIGIHAGSNEELSLFQQTKKMKGKVIETNSAPVPGAQVVIVGSTKGVLTDENGVFEMENVKIGERISITYLGMETKEVVFQGEEDLIIVLSEKVSDLAEVTVVAFGRQKKESVIGSITTVSPATLKVPSSNMTTAFAGQMAGVIAYQRSGEPGADNADFFVRGITTFGTNRNPLILIDNVELTSTDLARLQPDDIASFSVMKDATATALYGARGANGVLLITTKQGEEGPTKISLRIENSFSSPTKKVELADPITWMQLANEAVLTRNPMGYAPFTAEKIENTIRGTDPYRYPAVDWMDMLIEDNTMNQRINLSLTGGGQVARYYVAGAYSHDNGIMKVDKRNNFNNNINNNVFQLRSNIELRLTKTTNLNIRLNATFDDFSGPITSGADMFKNIVKSNSVLFPAYYSNTGKYEKVKHILFGNRDNQYSNPYAESVRGYKDKSRSQILAQLEGTQQLDFLTEGLLLRGMINFSRLAQFSVQRAYTPYWYEMHGIDPITGEYMLTSTNTGTDWLSYYELPNDKITQAVMYSEVMANYNREFGDHGVSGLLVLIMREQLDANTGTLEKSLPHRNVGLSGRFTYAYASRYFFEFNFGYNGSERFASNHRYGFFPSAGAAWTLSNENFWEPLRNTINMFKLRYSYGLVGNDQIGREEDRFYYLSLMNMNDEGRLMTFGRRFNNTVTGISMARDANPEIGWEIAYKSNYAVEMDLWKSNFKIIAEYFREKRTNILMARSYVPETMGLTYAVNANVGEALGKGFDFSLEYQKSWTKDLWTSARANYTYATSEYLVYDEPAYEEPWRSRIGYPISQQWGYIAERLFVDDAETLSAPKQEISTYPYGGGDIKYTDVNKDGRITLADQVPIGLPTTPEIVYGFGASVGYKGVDFSLFFQGLTNESFWINGAYTSPFVDNTQLLKVYADDYWSESNSKIYATWPRLSYDRNTNNVGVLNYNDNSTSFLNTWFMRDGSFLRLKNMELGYTIPGKWQDKLRIKNLRFYVNGTNLFLWSKFKLWDVEMGDNGLGYPIQRVINVGINLSIN
jgi:TonB-linked SusC/RagA family outer membrane protein